MAYAEGAGHVVYAEVKTLDSKAHEKLFDGGLHDDAVLVLHSVIFTEVETRGLAVDTEVVALLDGGLDEEVDHVLHSVRAGHIVVARVETLSYRASVTYRAL